MALTLLNYESNHSSCSPFQLHFSFFIFSNDYNGGVTVTDNKQANKTEGDGRNKLIRACINPLHNISLVNHTSAQNLDKGGES